MKAEFTEKDPKFNLLKPDGVRSQAHSEVITQVLLNDGNWYAIRPGSFKFYRTAGDKSVPFVQFDVLPAPGSQQAAPLRIEVFPATISGIAYPMPDVEAEVVPNDE
jgi:hypothetical protein